MGEKQESFIALPAGSCPQN